MELCKMEATTSRKTGYFITGQSARDGMSRNIYFAGFVEKGTDLLDLLIHREDVFTRFFRNPFGEQMKLLLHSLFFALEKSEGNSYPNRNQDQGDQDIFGSYHRGPPKIRGREACPKKWFCISPLLLSPTT